MLRGCLEAEGIPATLGDAQTIQTDTLLTVALGGIRVMVPSPFADAARLTIDAFERGALAIDELPDDAAAAAPEIESTSGFPAVVGNLDRPRDRHRRCHRVLTRRILGRLSFPKRCMRASPHGHARL